jgi:tetratricopeptide (TPR) repeat protein
LLSACNRADVRAQVSQVVSQIRRADYEGDQETLKKCYEALTPFLETQGLAARVRYWRGFDLWRQAINGFNDGLPPTELETDLKKAIDEFKQALALDPAFVDAKIGMVSCLGFTAFMHRKAQARARELIGQMLPLLKEAKEAAPDNPRLLWVMGPVLWNTPAERGGGQDKAIANYQRGVELASQLPARQDELEPSWGKPELLMSLSYSYLNKTSPDADAAERHARAALEIVPYWHYVRDILLPQILASKAKS